MGDLVFNLCIGKEFLGGCHILHPIPSADIKEVYIHQHLPNQTIIYNGDRVCEIKPPTKGERMNVIGTHSQNK